MVKGSERFSSVVYKREIAWGVVAARPDGEGHSLIMPYDWHIRYGTERTTVDPDFTGMVMNSVQLMMPQHVAVGEGSMLYRPLALEVIANAPSL